MGFLKKAGRFFGDVGKSVAYVAAAPVNSITGHDYNPDFKTKLGEAVGGSAIVGVDGIHTVFKSFADTITGGLATKGVNLIRKDKNKEQAFNYTEMRNHDFDTKLMNGYQKGVKKASSVLGLVAGAVVGGKKANEVLGGGAGPGNPDTLHGSLEGNIPSWALPVAAVIVLILIFKK